MCNNLHAGCGSAADRVVLVVVVSIVIIVVVVVVGAAVVVVVVTVVGVVVVVGNKRVNGMPICARKRRLWRVPVHGAHGDARITWRLLPTNK